MMQRLAPFIGNGWKYCISFLQSYYKVTQNLWLELKGEVASYAGGRPFNF